MITHIYDIIRVLQRFLVNGSHSMITKLLIYQVLKAYGKPLHEEWIYKLGLSRSSTGTSDCELNLEMEYICTH